MWLQPQSFEFELDSESDFKSISNAESRPSTESEPSTKSDSEPGKFDVNTNHDACRADR